MHTHMLQRIHASHQWPDACVRQAGDVIFWPEMTSEIRHLASQCSTCSDYNAKQQEEPLLSPEIPTTPWTIVLQDLFTFAGKSYLITIDYYSDFWELDAMTDTSSKTIVEHTKSHFARYGIPVKVITDNWPQFQAQVYEEFAAKWGFNHVTSSPYHSRSNGKAEATVKIAKTCWKKWLKIFVVLLFGPLSPFWISSSISLGISGSNNSLAVGGCICVLRTAAFVLDCNALLLLECCTKWVLQDSCLG